MIYLRKLRMSLVRVQAHFNVSVLFLHNHKCFDVLLFNVVEQLLVGLKDKETIVRWSSAKG